MKTHARVAVIGGGIMGCAMLHQLVRQGCGDAVLIEKGELTSGSTWHAAGLLPRRGSNRRFRECTRVIAFWPTVDREPRWDGPATGWADV